MVYGAVNRKGEKYYTYLKKLFDAINNKQLEYNWLITDCTCYPENPKTDAMLRKDYCWLSGEELTDLVAQEDFQWIWAVFSVVPIDYTKEDILKYDLPYCASYYNQEYNPFDKEPRLQHPLAKFELYAVDSTYIFIVTEDIELIDRFKKNYLV